MKNSSQLRFIEPKKIAHKRKKITMEKTNRQKYKLVQLSLENLFLRVEKRPAQFRLSVSSKVKITSLMDLRKNEPIDRTVD